MKTTTSKITIDSIVAAAENLKEVIVRTPLLTNHILSERYNANIVLKREDLQVVRSYKIRGAFHKIHSLAKEQLNACGTPNIVMQLAIFGVANVVSCEKRGQSGRFSGCSRVGRFTLGRALRPST